jgi:hypothetical protein
LDCRLHESQVPNAIALRRSNAGLGEKWESISES